ncbi:MAG: family 43 glycosylhydrolase, partial [Lachnospiraceae bacterium]|nr:family 43 glycosylhydrolase [Lachnospiraceae bacterium]
MQKPQAFNPFLPLNECIPDGEPHVFDDRIYLYGSHDKEGGNTFCMLDYAVYSAPVDDLSNWTCKGISYKASQDPAYPNRKYMYAPDVVQGNDGRFYLYYCMSGDYGVGGYTEPISVAVCDTPDGKFEYLGHVQNKDKSLMKKYVCFDPGVINDNGVIRLYYGTQYGFEEEPGFYQDEDKIKLEMDMFGRTREEILSYPDSIMGPVMLVLEDDMLTVKEEAHHIIPYKVKGTEYEEHPFFEASSIRKVDGKYYFIYSSQKNHELCYATSDYPDRDFKYGGTIVSNGDVGFNGRADKDRLNMTGTTHGSIEKIGNDWYVFYHRLTHKTDYSRQACAEKIQIEKDGSIKQVEITSCGLNRGPLIAERGYAYPAVIACNITNGHMPHGSNSKFKEYFPNVNNEGNERFIA